MKPKTRKEGIKLTAPEIDLIRRVILMEDMYQKNPMEREWKGIFGPQLSLLYRIRDIWMERRNDFEPLKEGGVS